MNTTNRFWHVAAAVGLALLAVLLTTFYVTSYKKHVQNGESKVTVLVAAKDIPVDTPGSEIVGGAWLTKETVARRQVVPGALTTPEQVRDLIVTQPIFAGEQVTKRRFGTPAQRGVRAQLKGTQRVVGVTGDLHQVLAGTLRAGDHVDVVGGWELNDSNVPVSRVVVRDSLVVAAPAAPKAGANVAGTGYAVQLRLTDAQSQRVEWLIAHGKDWRLEIRPQTSSANSPRWYDTDETLLTEGAGKR
jgi:Flp pilus assembly protein CpaB